MILKKRVKRLETGGAGSTGLEDLPEALMKCIERQNAFYRRLRDMTDEDIADIAFNVDSDQYERSRTLDHLKKSEKYRVRALDALIEIEQSDIDRLRVGTGKSVGHDRELGEQLIRANEREIERLRNEKEVH